jgi:endonuclease IV
MRTFGFKLFSTNIYTAPLLVKECAEFVLSQNDMFIELMVVPSSSVDDLKTIKKQFADAQVRIHATYEKFDAGNRELEMENKKILALSQKAADIFNAQTIVVHAGIGHEQKYVDEAARQFKFFKDKRIVIENVPYFGCNGEKLLGNKPEEIAYIMNESGCGFCLDFSHAICAALSLNSDIEENFQKFFALRPSVYHMCDGNLHEAEDAHLHFGEGNYPLRHYLTDYTSDNAYITMETGKGVVQHNNLLIDDYNYLKALI